jgi:hypothetical protein
MDNNEIYRKKQFFFFFNLINLKKIKEIVRWEKKIVLN